MLSVEKSQQLWQKRESAKTQQALNINTLQNKRVFTIEME